MQPANEIISEWRRKGHVLSLAQGYLRPVCSAHKTDTEVCVSSIIRAH